MAMSFRSPAATVGSSEHSDQKAVVIPASRTASTTNTHVIDHQRQDSDLSHAGTWITVDQYRSIASAAEVHSQPRPCARHLAIREACSIGQSNTRIASLLKDPYAVASRSFVGAGLGDGVLTATCTCGTVMEVDGEQVKETSDDAALDDGKVKGLL